MPSPDLARAAEAIAADRRHGAAELLAQLLVVLHRAVAAGREATIDVARIVCTGQPAMAPLWNACAAAVADFEAAGRFARVSDEMARAPRALARAAKTALSNALAVEGAAHVVTLSYSSGVAAAMSALARDRPLTVISSQSLPGGEGQRMCEELSAAGARVESVADALLTTYLGDAHAVVVGADAISAQDWTNKCGTLGLVAAASVTQVPVFVVASRDKAQASALRRRVSVPRLFERTPVELATLFLTDAGPIAPVDIPKLSERFAPEMTRLLSIL